MARYTGTCEDGIDEAGWEREMARVPDGNAARRAERARLTRLKTHHQWTPWRVHAAANVGPATPMPRLLEAGK